MTFRFIGTTRPSPYARYVAYELAKKLPEDSTIYIDNKTGIGEAVKKGADASGIQAKIDDKASDVNVIICIETNESDILRVLQAKENGIFVYAIPSNINQPNGRTDLKLILHGYATPLIDIDSFVELMQKRNCPAKKGE